MSSETLTQMLARNPATGAGLARGDALRLLDVSATGIAKDAMITLAEMIKILASTGAQANASGSTLAGPEILAIQHVEEITFSGVGSTTRIIILDTSNSPVDGTRVAIRCLMPATADITVEFRNSADDGDLLTSFVTDDTGDDKVVEFYFDGTQWQFLRFDSYATA